MNFSTFHVVISGKTYKVRAFKEKEAIVLAQAQAIQEGRRDWEQAKAV